MSSKARLLTQVLPELAQQLRCFEQQIQQIAEVGSIDLNQYQIDHIALRANEIQTAQQWQQGLSRLGSLISNNEINGRPILLFKLTMPLICCDQLVSIVELPFPTQKKHSLESWEHIEIVMPFLFQENIKRQETISQWQERILATFPFTENQDIQLKISQPKSEQEVLANPTIAISLKNKKTNPTCLKIHPYSLEQIISYRSKEFL